MADSIPPAVLNLVQSLPDDVQAKVIQYGAKAAMDPWFVPTASVPLALLLAFMPHAIKIGVVVPLQMLKYNNEEPRTTVWKNELRTG